MMTSDDSETLRARIRAATIDGELREQIDVAIDGVMSLNDPLRVQLWDLLRAISRRLQHSDALIDVLEERVRQDAQWGGSAHDDEHEPEDWLRFIHKQWLLASNEAAVVQARTTFNVYELLDRADARFIKIAALAFAGLDQNQRRRATVFAGKNDPAPLCRRCGGNPDGCC